MKGDSASAWTYTIICIFFASLLLAVILKYTKKSHRRKRYAKKRNRK